MHAGPMLIERICARICGDVEATKENRAAALRAFEDTIAVALAGWREPVSRAARRYGAGAEFPLIDGNGGAASAEHAAFVHAVAGHALDYDDVHIVSVTHPSVVIIPALMALVSKRAAARSILDAYGVGVSVNIAIGRMLGFEHYARGWHATSTIGPLAAAAAGCHLLKLDEGATRSALALAAAQSAGLQRNFGSMAKAVQAGNAAAAGVRAVLLAADDVSADSNVFGQKGFADLYGSDGMDPASLKADDVHSVSLKLYPCCYASHRLIGAAHEARSALGAEEEMPAIERIEVWAPFETMRPLRVVDPKSGNEAKFCAAYVLAVALLQGRVGLADFTDEAVNRPEVRALMQRVRIEDDAASGRAAIGLANGRVDVRLYRSGLRAEGSCSKFPGSPDSPPLPAELEAKIEECAAVYSTTDVRTLTRGGIRQRVLDLTAERPPERVADVARFV
jgi:2-methylcitrate dehydratase PrpD